MMSNVGMFPTREVIARRVIYHFTQDYLRHNHGERIRCGRNRLPEPTRFRTYLRRRPDLSASAISPQSWARGYTDGAKLLPSLPVRLPGAVAGSLSPDAYLGLAVEDQPLESAVRASMAVRVHEQLIIGHAEVAC